MEIFLALLVVFPIVAGAIAYVVELWSYDNGHVYDEDKW